MSDEINLPALRKQFTELVIAGSTERAEEAFSEAVEEFGDLAVVEVLATIEPQITSLHLSAFDGGKLSLATLLVPPQAWAESLAFFAAKWREDDIENDPEILAEALLAHVHGVIFSTDDPARRSELLAAAAATDSGIIALTVLFSLAPEDILEIADNIHSMRSYVTGSTENDHDVVPLAIELAKASEDGWERALYELYPNFLHDPDSVREKFETEEEEGERTTHRSTQELLYRLRKLVPTRKNETTAPSKHKRLGSDIFS
ncbi:MAG: hypothetical protein ABL902_03750 [Gallionella sp.]|nr:hypothetical protein [Gallionella sp.]